MTTNTPESTTGDTCPFCGSLTTVDSFFRTTCDNLLDFRSGYPLKIAGERTPLCKERELRQKAEAELAEVKVSMECKRQEFSDFLRRSNKALYGAKLKGLLERAIELEPENFAERVVMGSIRKELEAL